MKFVFVTMVLFAFACNSTRRMQWPTQALRVNSGVDFYHHPAATYWKSRDSLAVDWILKGNIPRFFRKFRAVRSFGRDSLTGKKLRLTYFVSPDYLCVGRNDAWARINISPRAAQRIADSLGCFLPTRKIVDDIYKAAAVKLEPIPLYALRDSVGTMYMHHLLIEKQRGNRKGLIAGIKKDIIITEKMINEGQQNRVAIYGWHKKVGLPIQPVYVRHLASWVDYSQGVRLIYKKMKLNGRWVDHETVFRDSTRRFLLSDESTANFLRYKW